MITSKTSRTTLATAALAAILLTGACSGDDGVTSSADRAEQGASQEDAAAPDPAGAEEEAGEDAADVADRDTALQAPDESIEQAVISTGTISLETDDVADARFEVQKVVDTHRGSISQQETTTGEDGEVETARLVLRIPSEEFGAATAALEEVASLVSSTYGSEDVTTEVIDVEARVRAQEKSVRRIEALLAEAEDLRTLMAVESELSRRQAELDSLKSRQKWLADQTSMANITVYVERTAGSDDDTERGGFLGGLAEGWDSFVAALTGTAVVLGFVVPWLALVGVLGGGGWLLLRLIRRSRKAATPADASN